jgi:hypothetical protein
MLSQNLQAAAPASHFFVVTEQHLGWLDGLIKSVIVLNLLDIVFTLFWVRAGRAQELNVLLYNLVMYQPVGFAVAKISLVSLGSFLLWKHRGHPLAAVGIFVIFMVYYLVLLEHLRFTSSFLGV